MILSPLGPDKFVFTRRFSGCLPYFAAKQRIIIKDLQKVECLAQVCTVLSKKLLFGTTPSLHPCEDVNAGAKINFHRKNTSIKCKKVLV